MAKILKKQKVFIGFYSGIDDLRKEREA